MRNTFDLFAYLIGIVVLVSLGYSDLRKRRIDHEWRYIILLVAGVFTRTGWLAKGICVVVIPALLLIIANRLAAHKNKKFGMSMTELDIVGGADIKTLASAGFLFGPYLMAFAIAFSLPLALVFIWKPTLGMQDELRDGEAAIPFCTLLALGMLLCLSFIFFLE